MTTPASTPTEPPKADAVSIALAWAKLVVLESINRGGRTPEELRVLAQTYESLSV